MEFLFDLQLFGEEGGGANDGGADASAGQNAEAGQNAGNEQETPAGAAATTGENPGSTDAAGTEKPGTILGGKEEETAWDFRGVVPEGMVYDEASASAYTAVAKELGLSGEQAQKLAGYGMQYAQQHVAAVKQAWAEEVNGWATAAKTELGAKFDATVKAAGTGIEAVEKVIPGVRQALDETGAGNRIELIRAFALIGGLVGEDNFRGFGAPAATTSTRYPKTNFDNY